MGYWGNTLWMYLLSVFLIISLAFGNVEELIKKEIYEKFGEDVKVRKIKLKTFPEKVEKIELDMEYGRTKTIAYIYSGSERHQAYIDALWKVKVFIALEDIGKGSPIKPELFKVEERFMKTIPSDLRLFTDELSNFIASTRIPKGTILRRSLLREIPAVRSGEMVEAVYKSGDIEIAFKAIAIDTGSVGKVIRLKRDEKILRGKVISKGKVEILP